MRFIGLCLYGHTFPKSVGGKYYYMNKWKYLKEFRIWTEDEIEYLKKEYTTKGVNVCAKHLDRSKQSIYKRAAILKLTMSKRVRAQMCSISQDPFKKYVINRDMLINVTTKEAAYVLGLLWADGSLKNGNTSTISIGNKISDMEELTQIFNVLGTWNIRKRHNTLQFRCSDTFLYQHLVDNDYLIKSGAPATKILNNIPIALHRYWWRGYLDGDGCILKNQQKVVFAGTYNQDWSFADYLNIPYTIEQQIMSLYRWSKLKYTKKAAVKQLLDFIYNEYDIDHIGLKRKYIIYQSYYKNK